MNDFIVETLGKDHVGELPADYWKINIYYQAMGNTISNFKSRFDSLPLAESLKLFLKLDIKNSETSKSN